MNTIDSTDPHCAGEVICHDCQYQWVGVWPEGASDLQCPQCGSTNTGHGHPKAAHTSVALKAAARDTTGKVHVFDIPAPGLPEHELRQMVSETVTQETKNAPVVVLTAIRGGKA